LLKAEGGEGLNKIIQNPKPYSKLKETEIDADCALMERFR
jgi:hypothetical protein